MTAGLPVALAAAVLHGVAPVVQTAVARAEPGGRGLGLRLLARLVRRPLWLAGIGCEAAGFLVELYAFSVAPAALVAPVMATDAAVATLLARRVGGERLSRAGYCGVASMILGIGVLAAVAGDTRTGAPASNADVLLFGVCGALAVAIGAYRGRPATAPDRRGRAPLWLGAGAGVCYAVATQATRQLGLLLGGGELWRIALTPAPYLLIVFSVAGAGLFQRGLQSGGAALTFPLTSGPAALLPVVVSLTVLGESRPAVGAPSPHHCRWWSRASYCSAAAE